MSDDLRRAESFWPAYEAAEQNMQKLSDVSGIPRRTLQEWKDKLEQGRIFVNGRWVIPAEYGQDPGEAARELLEYLKSRQVPLGEPPRVKCGDKEYATELIGCDLQYPFHHEGAWEVFLGVCEKLQPEGVTLNGDTWDMHYLSRYRKDPRIRADMQADIDEVRERILGRVNQVAPNARRVVTLGNHDWVRWETYLMENAPEIMGLHVLENYPAILGLDEMGWDCAKDGYWLIPDVFQVYHGTRITNTIGGGSAQSAKKEMIDFGGCSGASGHTHRLGKFYRRDAMGFKVWAEGGCLCDQFKMRQAGVTTHKYGLKVEDWHLGFVRVDYKPSGDSFVAQDIPILESKGRTFCIVDEQEISA